MASKAMRRAASKELSIAIKRADISTALDLLKQCTHKERPPVGLYNQLLSMLEQTEQRQFVRSHMVSMGVAPDEGTISLDVRAFMHEGDLKSAIAVLSANDATIEPKLRTYAPVMHGLFARHDLRRALELRERMVASNIQLGEDENVGFVCSTAGAVSQKQAVVTDDDAASPASLVSRLRELQAAHTTLGGSSIDRLQLALNVPELRTRGGHACAASVNEDGVCSGCGTQLSALPLAASDHEAFHHTMLSAADALGKQAGADMRAFCNWVGERVASSYVIDAANVGYRHQNVVGGAFSFAQIELARTTLKAKAGGVEPLIVIPSKYLHHRSVPNHTSSRGSRRANAPKLSAVSQADEELVAGWRAAGALWSTPNGLYDDWYWMLAAVLIGPTARVLTMDEMRDHRMEAVMGHTFTRWKARHVLRYRFDFACMPTLHQPRPDTPPLALVLAEPPCYSVEIQSHEQGARWHFPLREEINESGEAAARLPWLCAAIPSAKESLSDSQAGETERERAEPSVTKSRWQSMCVVC